MKKTIFSFYIVLIGVASSAQSLNELYKESQKAYEAKDSKTYLDLTIKLDSLRPSHPVFTYNLASAYALNENFNKTIDVLETLILMNNKTEFEKDEDFKNLATSEEYQNLQELKSRLEKKVESSKKIISLEEKDLHPEGLLYLEKSKTWLATSIRKRKIVSFNDKTGSCSDWISGNEMLAVFAIKADKSEKFLWVATAAIPEMENFSKDLDGKSEILKIDIKKRKIVNRFAIEGNHIFGDLIISNANEIFISDSNKPILYKIKDDKISEWLHLEKEAFNLQGIAIDDSGSAIFIADYLKGILKISISDKENRSWLKFPKGTTHKGIDGLLFYKNSLIAIHNGVQPIRIVQYHLDNQNKAIKSFKILDNNRPEFNEPALSFLKDSKMYFFSNSPWKAYSKEFELDLGKFDNPMLFKMKLE